MTAESPEPALTVDELAARAGVTVRTIRFYSTRGLLPPPALGPRRVGRYGPGHLARLALIEELQRQGMTLAAIERYLARLPTDLSPHDLAVHRALVASWAPDDTVEVSRAELERRAGRPLNDHDLDRLAAMDVLTPTEAEDAYRVDNGLLGLGIQLLDLPIAHELVLAARAALLEHSRAAAADLARLFRDAVGAGDGPGDEASAGGADPDRMAQVRSLSADMQPLVVQALVTIFQRSLRQELREWLRKD